MSNKTIRVRMTMKTYQRFRKYFKAKRKETAANYFERLINYLEIEHPEHMLKIE